MNRRSASSFALIMTLFASTVCPAQGAGELSKETSAVQVGQCVAQHDSARQLRLEEQWLSSRAAMLSCADERCPLAIAADCRAWLDELIGLMPTLLVVVEAEELAAHHSALLVELDGTRVELSDPPRPIELLPGTHRLRLELRGRPPVERQFELAKGEKNHIERIRFAPPPSAPPPPHAAPRSATRPVPTSTYWYSAGALVAFASSAAFLVSGLKEHSDARDICAPNCGRSISTSIQARLLLADITGGAGLVLGGLAAYTYLRRPVVFSKTPPSGPAVSANAQGISLVWRGQF